MIRRLFKSNTATDYQKLSEEVYAVKQQELSNMSASTVKFSVGANPEGAGAVVVFTMSNGMTTTITMPPENVRLLIDLLAVVVPEDAE
jgi:hypothetical protein